MKSNSSLQPAAETSLHHYSYYSLVWSTGYQTIRSLHLFYFKETNIVTTIAGYLPSDIPFCRLVAAHTAMRIANL